LVKKYLGIDESNHGRFPEIFVGLYSENPSDIYSNCKLAKVRHNHSLDNILKTRDFRFLTIDSRKISSYSKKENLFLPDSSIKAIALSHLIRYYNRVEEIYVDGKLPSNTIEYLESIIYPQKLPRIISEDKGDNKYPIINYADMVAHYIYKSYKKNNSFPYDSKKLPEISLMTYSDLAIQYPNKKNKDKLMQNIRRPIFSKRR
jgi:hypothetical protein